MQPNYSFEKRKKELDKKKKKAEKEAEKAQKKAAGSVPPETAASEADAQTDPSTTA